MRLINYSLLCCGVVMILFVILVSFFVSVFLFCFSGLVFAVSLNRHSKLSFAPFIAVDSQVFDVGGEGSGQI